MFGLFKKKSELEILQEKYAKLMQESFELSKVNRAKADEKFAEATKLMDDIDKITGNV